MDHLVTELESWRTAPVEQAMVRSVSTHTALQPRDASAVRFAERRHVERESQQHVGTMLAFLEADPTHELEPLLIARISGKRYVVDGHHRLTAYRRSGRQFVPVRLKSTTLDYAVLLSTLVNVTNRALLLTVGQRSESMWRYLIAITGGGQRTLRQRGTSERKVMELFGVRSKGTIGTMMKHMQFAHELRDSNVVAAHERNPVSGWPTWRCVCRLLRPETSSAQLDDVKRRRRDKAAIALAAMVDQLGPEEVEAILREVTREAQDSDEDAPDGLPSSE